MHAGRSDHTFGAAAHRIGDVDLHRHVRDDEWHPYVGDCVHDRVLHLLLPRLAFLLVKEERTVGSVQVVVQGHGFLYAVQLPVGNRAQVTDYAARVNYAHSLSASRAG